jgi:hypothetical protein
MVDGFRRWRMARRGPLAHFDRGQLIETMVRRRVQACLPG